MSVMTYARCFRSHPNKKAAIANRVYSLYENFVENDVFSDRCNMSLFLLSKAMKLLILTSLAATLLFLAPALDQTEVEAKQSITAHSITTQLAAFELR